MDATTQQEIPAGTVVVRRGDKARKLGTVQKVQVMGWPKGKYGPLPSPIVTVRWHGKADRGAYLTAIGLGGNIGQTTTVAAARLEREDGTPLFSKPKAERKPVKVYDLYVAMNAAGGVYATFLSQAGADRCAAAIGGTVKHQKARKLPASYSW